MKLDLGKRANIRPDGVGDSLWGNLWIRQEANLGDSLWENLQDSLWGSLRSSLGGSLWFILKDRR